jgi:FtsH-binding integral membrane protein
MKKALLVIAILGGSIMAYAQDKPEPLVSRELIFDVIHICTVVLIIYLISSFIIQLVRRNFDFRLKSRILEKQPGEEIVSQLVQPDKTNPRQTLLQWICALLGIGAGFLLMHFNQPFGLQSLAIMAFCVAGGLGLYFILTKRNNS